MGKGWKQFNKQKKKINKDAIECYLKSQMEFLEMRSLGKLRYYIIRIEQRQVIYSKNTYQHLF